MPRLQLARSTSKSAPAPPHRRFFHTPAQAPEPRPQKLHRRHRPLEVYTTALFFAEFPSCSATAWICAKRLPLARKLEKRSAAQWIFLPRNCVVAREPSFSGSELSTSGNGINQQMQRRPVAVRKAAPFYPMVELAKERRRSKCMYGETTVTCPECKAGFLRTRVWPVPGAPADFRAPRTLFRSQ